MTLFFLTVDLDNDYLNWVRAGHDPALLYDPERDLFEELGGEGIALGVNETAVYPISSYKGLVAGQVIAVGTDGLWEARNSNGTMFGKSQLKNLIRLHHYESAEKILDSIFEAILEHTNGTRSEDDMTLVILKIA